MRFFEIKEPLRLLGYYDVETKKFYTAKSHHEAQWEVYHSGDYPEFTETIDNLMNSIDDEDDIEFDISDYFPLNLVLIGDMDNDGEFFVEAPDEKTAKQVASDFSKKLIQNNVPVFIDVPSKYFNFSFPEDRMKFLQWITS